MMLERKESGRRRSTHSELIRASALFPEALSDEVQEVTTLSKKKVGSYEEFVEKFKVAKTTDDCFTPDEVYDVVLQYVTERCPQIKGKTVLRPFYPGGNYQLVDYTDSVVIDNPPFSIISEIKKFYTSHDIPFFLFAPSLTLFSSYISNKQCTSIVVNAPIIYENGASVNTSFISNLFGDLEVILDGGLRNKITLAQKKNKPPSKPIYTYPDNVISAALLGKYTKDPGCYIEIGKSECHYVRRLDCQIDQRKAIFGGGYLLGNKAVRKIEQQKIEQQKIEQQKIEQQKIELKFELSTREQEIIKKLK